MAQLSHLDFLLSGGDTISLIVNRILCLHAATPKLSLENINRILVCRETHRVTADQMFSIPVGMVLCTLFSRAQPNCTAKPFSEAMSLQATEPAPQQLLYLFYFLCSETLHTLESLLNDILTLQRFKVSFKQNEKSFQLDWQETGDAACGLRSS